MMIVARNVARGAGAGDGSESLVDSKQANSPEVSFSFTVTLLL